MINETYKHNIKVLNQKMTNETCANCGHSKHIHNETYSLCGELYCRCKKFKAKNHKLDENTLFPIREEPQNHSPKILVSNEDTGPEDTLELVEASKNSGSGDNHSPLSAEGDTEPEDVNSVIRNPSKKSASGSGEDLKLKTLKDLKIKAYGYAPTELKAEAVKRWIRAKKEENKTDDLNLQFYWRGIMYELEEFHNITEEDLQ